MTILLADGTVLERDCPLIEDDAPQPDTAHAITLARYQAEAGGPTPHALSVGNDADVQTLELPWASFKEVWLEFPSFVEGQAYSQARLLRTRLEYRGLLLAHGDVLLDQLFYMRRCGFDAFALRDDQSVTACRAALKQFSDAYVSAANQNDGILARRIA